jgi:hypothetical protein
MLTNGFGLGEGGELKVRMFNLARCSLEFLS